jgi:hypothetical protein
MPSEPFRMHDSPAQMWRSSRAGARVALVAALAFIATPFVALAVSLFT